MAAQLIELTRKVFILTSRAQQSNEVCGLHGVFGHETNMCPHNLYEPEQLNYMDANQPWPRFDLYENTYNLRWMSNPNFVLKNNNQAPMQNAQPNPMSNNDGPSDQLES